MNCIAKNKVEIRHLHLLCGLGGGAAGFNKGHARVGSAEASFRCIGGIDVDAGAIRDFERLAGVPGTVLDLFNREQYVAFHGKEPGPEWREATTTDIHNAAGGERPHIIFLSAPCKGFSGLLSEAKSGTDKYQALNGLTLRGVWLALEAYKDDPVEMFVFENVPRIANRGRQLLDQITALFRHYGYAVAETTHDCGELGGLAQSRKRFLLVARHQAKIPAFLYEPHKKNLRGVGEVLGRMPLPGDPAGGPMHRVPSLQWKTWVRLAFVQAGKDWRSLRNLNVKDGYLSDYLILPDHRADYLGVMDWNKTAGAVSGRGGPTNGKYSVADPRFPASEGYEGQQYGVLNWKENIGAVTGQRSPGQGRFSVADPRPGFSENAHQNIYKIVKWDEPGKTVTGASHAAAGAGCVADPRGSSFAGKYKVTKFDEPASTVISGSTTGQGAFAIADPRPSMNRTKGDHYLTGGHYGVVPWDAASGAVSASACHDNGRWSVADPRLPAQQQKLIAVIRALDGTWHRPFTTLELAALQSLYDPEDEEILMLDGLSDSDWRERIGNAVPPDAAEAIASVMGETLLLAWSGETFTLSSTPLWVRNVAMALSVSGV